MSRRRYCLILFSMIVFPSCLLGSSWIEWPCEAVWLRERWPGAEAGWDWDTVRKGIGLSRPQSGGDVGIKDWIVGWDATPDDARGLVGMLEGEFESDARIEIAAFGRQDDAILLRLVIHPTGGVLPDHIRGVVQRKLNRAEDRHAPVTPEDIQRSGIGGKRVLLAADFPFDLPPGEYAVTVELLDERQRLLQRHECRLVRKADKPDPLRELSNEELLSEFMKRARALPGGTEPTDYGRDRIAAAYIYRSPRASAWQATEAEIVRRGTDIVPELLSTLEKEAVRNPGKVDFHNAPFGLATPIMDLLAAINDPRAAPLLVRVASGMDGQVNNGVRDRAIETLESLTKTRFLLNRNSARGVAMAAPDAILLDDPEQATEQVHAEVASLYEKWLAGEGSDPSKWRPLAQQRARDVLQRAPEIDSPLRLRDAINFLTGSRRGVRGDDQPEQTVAALARLASDKNPIIREAFAPIGGVASVLAQYGPIARPHFQIIFEQLHFDENWYAFKLLAEIGGEASMAFMIQALPQLRRAMELERVDANAHWENVSDTRASQALSTYRACRWGIERWAGRAFPTDDAIEAWWQTAKARSQQQWLEESLEITAARADMGDAKAQRLLRLMIPDLPHPDADQHFLPPVTYSLGGLKYSEFRPPPHRVDWLRAHRAQLVYDEKWSCFRPRK
jgi:hypothetical protein